MHYECINFFFNQHVNFLEAKAKTKKKKKKTHSFDREIKLTRDSQQKKKKD